MIKKIIPFLVFLFSYSFSPAQDSKMIKKADAAFAEGNFLGALHLYEQQLAKASEDPYLNHQVALCYLNASPKNKALNYAANAVKFSEKPSNEMYFTLARTYHLSHQFNEAIAAYQKSDPGNTNKKAISKLIKECQYGNKYLFDQGKEKITNAGQLINTEYQEYLPYITADLSRLYFTSRRPGSTGGKKELDGQQFEDIYSSTNKGGAWDAAVNMGSPVNSDGHDACIGISNDGQTMFIYKGSNGGDIYISQLKGKRWSIPEPLDINSPFFESSACISPDERTLFFTRAADFKSNKDIYMCSRTVGGTWSKPKKMHFNTEYDEDAPFMHPDGKTLYFSSKGHSTMGGYDVFKTTMLSNGAFSEPVNLGYPINTANDDVFFVLSADGKIGFYSSDRDGGQGRQDIYSIRMPVASTNSPQLALLKGKVKDVQSGKPIEAEITIIDNNSRELLSKLKSNSATGEYLVSLPSGRNYNIAVEKEGYVFYSENINFKETEGYKEKANDILLMPLKTGSKVVLKNIFFDSNKDELRPESIVELQRLAKLLIDNTSLRIEVSGHTDNTGDAALNMALSEKRAKSVYEFLLRNGISANRLSYKGYGNSQPIDSNETAEGRQNNRRTEFRIL